MKTELINFLQEKEKPGNWLNIANRFHISGTNKQKSDYVRRLWYKCRIENKSLVTNFVQWVDPKQTSKIEFTTTSTYKAKPGKLSNLNKDNVLVIGDLHEPFCKEGYLQFCKEQQLRFNCGTVIFIGDIIDNHAQSFHNTNPDGLSAKEELEQATKKLEAWYKAFPNATVLLGNHDRIVARKLFGVGISQRWLRPLGEVLGTPNWKFVEQHIYNDVLYVHGESGTALKKAQNELCSVVQGHAHTEGYVHLINGGKNFAMQVGCGIDFDTYAFAYAQRGKRPIISCGVVLNQSPIIIPFV